GFPRLGERGRRGRDRGRQVHHDALSDDRVGHRESRRGLRRASGASGRLRARRRAAPGGPRARARRRHATDVRGARRDDRGGLSVRSACAAAGVLAAYACAGGTPSRAGATTSTTSSTSTAATTTVATTAVSGAQPLPEGVTVGGVPVGNLLPADADQAIRAYF